MGSHTWVRDEKRGGGHSFVAGVPAVLPQPSTKRRKLVWQRDDDSSTALKNHDSKSESVSGKGSRKDSTNEKPKRKESGLQEVMQKKAELEALKRNLEARRQELRHLSQSSKVEERERQKDDAREREERKRKLQAAFSGSFVEAKQSAAAEIAQSRGVEFADEKEIQRVLSASSDYGVLQLVPGADATAIRKRYKELAIRLHPDKCKVTGASEAFHRLVKAYQQLSKYT